MNRQVRIGDTLDTGVVAVGTFQLDDRGVVRLVRLEITADDGTGISGATLRRYKLSTATAQATPKLRAAGADR
jgi:hypothetical protein